MQFYSLIQVNLLLAVLSGLFGFGVFFRHQVLLHNQEPEAVYENVFTPSRASYLVQKSERYQLEYKT